MKLKIIIGLSIAIIINQGCTNNSTKLPPYENPFSTISTKIDEADKMRYSQEYENAILEYSDALEIATKYDESTSFSYELLLYLATSNKSIGNYKETLKYIEILEKKLIGGLNHSTSGYEKWKMYLRLLYLKGDIQLESGDYEEAKTSFLAVIDNIDKIRKVFEKDMDLNSSKFLRENYYMFSIIYIRLGQIYENSDSEKSKEFLDLAEEYAMKIEQNDILSEMFMLKGNRYVKEGEFEKANNCYTKAFDYLDDFITQRVYSNNFLFYDNNPIVMERKLLLKKALLFYKIGKQDEFLLIANQLINANKKIFTSPELFVALGDYYSGIDSNKSLKYYEEAEKNQQIIDFDKKSRGKLILSMANFYLSKKDYINAEKKIIEAQKIALEMNDVYFNIDTEICNGKLVSEKGAKELANITFNTMLTEAKKNDYTLAEIEILNYTGIDYINDGKFDMGISKLKESILSIEAVRKNTIDEESRLKYFEKQTKAYKYLAYAYTKLENPLDALKYAELSKARVMNEMLSNSSLDVDTNKFSLKNIVKNDVYFEYVNIDENRVVCIVVTQNNIESKVLNKEELNLDYGSQSEKIFNIDTRAIKLVKNNQDLEVKKTDYSMKAIINYNLAIKEQNTQVEDKLSYDLYNFFITPFEEEIKNKNHIIIIPDGFITYLPFETLKNKDSYLIENFNVSYNHSLTILEAIKQKNNSFEKNKVLLIGDVDYKLKEKLNDIIYDEFQMKINIKNKIEKEIPLYEEIDILNLDNLNYLKYAGEEIKGISNEVKDVNVLTKNNAKESVIKEMSLSGELEKYSILHFAVHGFYYEQFPNLSFIALQGDKVNDGFLTANEISKLKLKSNLVVLSACDTTIGKIYDGEGVIGVNSAFLIAGSKSVISTLWQISDRGTSTFFKEYYRELNKNTSLNNSLSKIKREFIKGVYGEEYKKPYYWAPFVFYGFESSIDE